MDISETFGVSGATINSSAPAAPHSLFQAVHRCTALVSDGQTTEAGWSSEDIRYNPLAVSPLSEATARNLRAILNMPLTALTPDQLIQFAQVVYTVLFKSYLLTMPGLLGSLCRIGKWCEVSEVEASLREQEVHGNSPSAHR